MTSPYREAPQLLLCPRCNDVLDMVFAGVAACPRCQGAWIGQGTLDTAFGNPRWPPGQNMWWHQELECPECAAEGTRTKMDARSASDVMVDLCPSHGLWLDQGELGRLMGVAEGSDELLELQKRVAAIAPDPDELVQRRLAWRSEVDARRREATEFRSWVEAEQKRKAAEAADAAARRAEAEAAERRRRKQLAIDAQQAAAQRSREEQERELQLQQLGERRVQIIIKLRELDKQQRDHRDGLAALDQEIAGLKAELREIDGQLDTGLPKPAVQ